jgi:hypothetical protein
VGPVLCIFLSLKKTGLKIDKFPMIEPTGKEIHDALENKLAAAQILGKLDNLSYRVDKLRHTIRLVGFSLAFLMFFVAATSTFLDLRIRIQNAVYKMFD